MERRAAEARYADLHDKRPYHNGTFQIWSDTRSEGFPYRYDDGVTIWVSDTDIAPDDKFLSPPLPPPLPQSPGEG